jgi:hypothetical protein
MELIKKAQRALEQDGQLVVESADGRSTQTTAASADEEVP